MALGIVVNTELLDLEPGTVIVTREGVYELGKIGDSKGSFSNSFQVPLTNKNIRLLGYVTISNLDTDAVNPYKHIPCDILDNDLIIRSGVLEIEEVNKSQNNISLTFYDNNTSFFEEIKNKSIRDLDLGDLEHIYNGATIRGSWTNDEGYVYVPVNYDGIFTVGSSNTMTVTQLAPATFVSTLVKRIIEQSGRTFAGSLFNDALFKKKIVGYSQENFVHDENWANQRSFLSTSTVSQAFNPTAVADTFTLEFDNDSSAPAQDPGGNFNTPTYTADKTHTGVMYVQIGGSYTMPVIDSATIQVWIYKNGAQEQLLDNLVIVSNGQNFTSFRAFQYSATAGDEYDVRLYVSAISTTGTHTLTVNLDDTSTNNPLFRSRFFADADSEITQGSEVQLPLTLPDISQSDFLNEILFRFQGVIQVEPKSQQVKIDLFNDIKKNIGTNFKDWSAKIDLSKNHAVEFGELVKDYGKVNKIIQQIDEESVPVVATNTKLRIPYGDGELLIDNDYLSEEEDLFESEVYPVANANAFVGANQLIDMPTYTRDGGLRFMIYMGEQSVSSLSFGTKSSMTIAGQSVTEMAWAYFDKRDFGDENIDTFRQTLNFESNTLKFLQGEGLKEHYFQDILKILNRPRLFRAFFTLNNLDFLNFDFIVPVFLDIEDESGYFYVNKLPENDLSSNESKEVELVKLI